MDRETDAIMISPRDNVVTVTREVLPGERVHYLLEGGVAELLSSGAPKYHKIAAGRIPKGGEVRKYGEVIAVATEDIPLGAHVHNHNVTSGVIK